MALRYLARRALQQRALVPRVPSSAGSRPVSTRGSSPSQNEPKAAAASKESRESELLGTDASKLTNEQIVEKVAKRLPPCTKQPYVSSEGLMEAARYKAIERWCIMGGAATGAGLAFLHIAYDTHKKGEITFGGRSLS